MTRKLFIVITFLLIINDYVYGKNVNKTKSIKLYHPNTKQKDTKSRARRSLDEDFDKLFKSTKDATHYGHVVEGRGQVVKTQPFFDKEPPFWGSRGRRDSSEEVLPNVQPAYSQEKYVEKINNLHRLYINYEDKLRKDEENSPFWGNRGRRDSEESDENDINVFWANRGRRQEDEPFWGTRGRREQLLRSRPDDDEPFWGNRGRRQEQDPFWANRGRRRKVDPLGTSKATLYISNVADEPFGENKHKLELRLKNYIIEIINHIQHKLGRYERNRRDEPRLPFWDNRGRESTLMSLFKGKLRNRLNKDKIVQDDQNKMPKDELRYKTFEPNTVHDDRIYAEEPRYILVERSSRSSAEDDPFFISRGKKYSDYSLDNGTRGRRGSIEELVKSVRNDPYYIARGKKQWDEIKFGNSTVDNDFSKTKELICSTVDILMSKFHGNKVKREINDNERNRRTILKKLALQLQMDPYYVSRGRKNDKSTEHTNSENFINNIVSICNKS